MNDERNMGKMLGLWKLVLVPVGKYAADAVVAWIKKI